MEGYVKLYRKSLDSPIFQNPKLWQVWCYCLMRANHKTTTVLFDGKEMLLHPGDFITGRFKGAEDCNMKPSTFWNQLNKLKRVNSIDIKSDNKKSIITLVNWKAYQDSKNKVDSNSDTYLDNKRTTSGHRQEWKNERRELIIESAKYLITEIKKKTSFYSMINKYIKIFGEKKIHEILTGCINREKEFANESRLAAYLEVCGNGRAQKQTVEEYDAAKNYEEGEDVHDEWKKIAGVNR